MLRSIGAGSKPENGETGLGEMRRGRKRGGAGEIGDMLGDGTRVSRVNLDTVTAGEDGDRAATSDGRLRGPDGLALERRLHKKDKVLREGQARSVGVGEGGVVMVTSVTQGGGDRVEMQQEEMMYDTGCTYTLLTAEAGKWWDGARKEVAKVTGFVGETRLARGGGMLYAMMRDSHGDWRVENLGKAYVVDGATDCLMGGGGAQRVGLGGTLRPEGGAELVSRAGVRYPLIQSETDGAYRATYIIVPTAFGKSRVGEVVKVEEVPARAPAERTVRAAVAAVEFDSLVDAVEKNLRVALGWPEKRRVRMDERVTVHEVPAIGGSKTSERKREKTRHVIGTDAFEAIAYMTTERSVAKAEKTVRVRKENVLPKVQTPGEFGERSDWPGKWKSEGQGGGRLGQGGGGAKTNINVPTPPTEPTRTRQEKSEKSGDGRADTGTYSRMSEGLCGVCAPKQTGKETGKVTYAEAAKGNFNQCACRTAHAAPAKVQLRGVKRGHPGQKQRRMEKEKEKKMAPVSDAATRRRRMRQGVSGRERVGSRRFGKEEFERRLRVMKRAHVIHNHASATKLNEMVKAGEIEGGMLVTTAMLNCPSCWQAKMTKPKQSKKFEKRVPSKAMWEVEYDLFEPAKSTRRNPHGYKYVAGFKCRGSGYVFRYFLKGKKAKDIMESLRAFERYLKEIGPQVKARLGYYPFVDTIVMDTEGGSTTTWGYRKSMVDAELIAKGVKRRFVGSGDAHAGGVERSWRTMDEAISASLAESGLDDSWYYFAAQHATMHYNNARTSANKLGGGMAPSEWLGLRSYRPKFQRPFGALAHRYVKNEDGAKGLKRGQRCVFVGYSGDVEMGYQVVDLNRRTLWSGPGIQVDINLGGVRDLVTEMRADPFRCAEHSDWVWRLWRFEPKAQLKKEGEKVEEGVIIDDLGENGRLQLEAPPEGPSSPTKKQWLKGERKGVIPREPNQEPLIMPNSQGTIGTDANLDSRAGLLDREEERPASSGADAQRMTKEGRKMGREEDEKVASLLIKEAKAKGWKLRWKPYKKGAKSMSAERLAIYSVFTTLAEVERARKTPIVYKYTERSSKEKGKDKVMTPGDLKNDIARGMCEVYNGDQKVSLRKFADDLREKGAAPAGKKKVKKSVEEPDSPVEGGGASKRAGEEVGIEKLVEEKGGEVDSGGNRVVEVFEKKVGLRKSKTKKGEGKVGSEVEGTASAAKKGKPEERAGKKSGSTVVTETTVRRSLRQPEERAGKKSGSTVVTETTVRRSLRQKGAGKSGSSSEMSDTGSRAEQKKGQKVERKSGGSKGKSDDVRTVEQKKGSKKGGQSKQTGQPSSGRKSGSPGNVTNVRRSSRLKPTVSYSGTAKSARSVGPVGAEGEAVEPTVKSTAKPPSLKSVVKAMQVTAKANIARAEREMEKVQAKVREEETSGRMVAAAAKFFGCEEVGGKLYTQKEAAMIRANIAYCEEATAAAGSNRRSELSGEMPWWLCMAVKQKVLVEVDGMREPMSMMDAMKMAEAKLWVGAVKKEVAGLVALGCWEEVDRSEVPRGRTIAPSHFVFKIKTEEVIEVVKDEKGEVVMVEQEVKDKYGKTVMMNGDKPKMEMVPKTTSSLAYVKCKARLVYGGHMSKYGSDYMETSAFVCSPKSVRAMLALAAPRGYKVCSWDVAQAFVQSKYEEEDRVYMELPPLARPGGERVGAEGDEEWYAGCGGGKNRRTVAKLSRRLYGSKDAPRAWQQAVQSFMDSIGARALISDRMSFRWKWTDPSGERHEMNMAVHVDDIVATPSSDAIRDEFTRRLKGRFGEDQVTGGEETKAVLGMAITRDWARKTITISQGGFARKMLKNFGYEDCKKKVNSPLPAGQEFQKWEGEPTDDELPMSYLCFVGSLNWLATSTRPDLSQACSMMSRYASNPGPEHIKCAKHILMYLAAHPDLGITYHGSEDVLKKGYDHEDRLIAAVDADLGGCTDTEKSTTGVVVWLNGGCISWKAKRQTTVATSTTQAEVAAAAAGSMEVVWLRDLVTELGARQECVRILEDNQGVVQLTHGQKDTSRSGHFRRPQVYVEDLVGQGFIWLDRTETDYNPADIFTKQVEPAKKFGYLRDVIMGIQPDLYLSASVKEMLDGREPSATNVLLKEMRQLQEAAR